ncbi:hypothetical protein HGRIS_008472 [Hohenbuehelia grisea]|uniref:Uncharacterized protein n=1 Tax=Hohenbuehelia grisea TaxID=104357 RepID=A0ABR3J9J8_9AGAR
MAFDIQLQATLRRFSLGGRPATANSTSSSSSGHSGTSTSTSQTSSSSSSGRGHTFSRRTSSPGPSSSLGSFPSPHSYSNPPTAMNTNTNRRTNSVTTLMMMQNAATSNAAPAIATTTMATRTAAELSISSASAGTGKRRHAADVVTSNRADDRRSSPQVSPTMRGWSSRPGSADGVGRSEAAETPGSPRSLAISPNLDALLEHDERVRRSRSHGGGGIAGPSMRLVAAEAAPASVVGHEPGIHIGLPPPPRVCAGRERRSRTAARDEDVEITANPYINRAPQFDGVGESDGSDRREMGREAMAFSNKNKKDSRPSTSSGTERAEQSSNISRTLALLAGKARLGPAKSDMESSVVIGQGQHPYQYVSHAYHSSASSSASTPAALHRPPRISTTLYDTPDRMSSLRNLVGHRTTNSVADRDVDRESFIDLLSPEPQRAAFAPARERSRSPKPPVPTSPKPLFNRPGSPLTIATRLSPRPSPAASPLDTARAGLPSTSNLLSADGRADLVRKSHKLAKMFGKPPGPAAVNQAAHPSHHRATASVSTTASSRKAPPVWPPPDGTQYLSLSNRRHSNPPTPDSYMTFATNSDLDSEYSPTSSNFHDDIIEIGTAEGPPSSDWIDSQRTRVTTSLPLRADSPTSFIDLSDGEDDAPGRLTPTRERRGRPPSSSAQSILENMTPEELAEEERRRKREKLTKLHRFLGSRVPANLVLDVPDPLLTLPPLAPSLDTDDSAEAHKAWLRRRRSSSAAAFPSSWSDELDRLKVDLNEREKAINVRRALKMEKVFGVAPPQTLYHTRGQAGPAYGASAAAQSALTLPAQGTTSTTTTFAANHSWKPRGASLPKPASPSSPQSASQGQARPIQEQQGAGGQGQTHSTPPSPIRRAKGKSRRPGTSESRKALLGGGFGFSGTDLDGDEGAEDGNGSAARRAEAEQNFGLGPSVRPSSYVYTHYQHSLNSLNDILDRDDKESLAELHEYLQSSEPDPPAPSADILDAGPSLTHRVSSMSLKSERRRSLPARTSILSLADSFAAGERAAAARESVYSLASAGSASSFSSAGSRASMISIASASSVSTFSTSGSGAATPTPGATDFQLRRRRAAKLTAFFGVNYRDLIQDILESIEKGLEDERKRGTLNPDEVEDLLQKLRTLRTKRGAVF